jgi:DNA-binding MarR family transcriptional regulator
MQIIPQFQVISLSKKMEALLEYLIIERKGPATPYRIAKGCNFAKSYASWIIKRAEAQGLVKRFSERDWGTGRKRREYLPTLKGICYAAIFEFSSGKKRDKIVAQSSKKYPFFKKWGVFKKAGETGLAADALRSATIETFEESGRRDPPERQEEMFKQRFCSPFSNRNFSENREKLERWVKAVRSDSELRRIAEDRIEEKIRMYKNLQKLL